MIKVAQVLAGAAQGGAENFFVRLVAGLHADGQLQQKAFIRDHEQRISALKKQHVEVEGFRFGGVVNFLDRRRYLRALDEFNPDIVMTWMNRASGLTPKGPYKLVCRLGHYYNLKYYRHADYWVGISKGICSHLVQGGMPADRVFHIPNFADETEVTPFPRDSFDTPASAPLLLAAGRLHVNKGFDILLKALVEIPDAILWLAGSGPEEASLKKLCSELGLSGRVRFLGWRNDVTALMRTVDLFVCPSRHEGLGSIVMESWAHRCPIVATASQGPGEVIADGETGLLVPVDDAFLLSRSIKSVLADRAMKDKIVDAAFDHYQRFYSKQVIVSQYNRFFTDIAGQARY
jgi:glycosyltransferase involved in cell wall biosynthesis